MTLRVRRDLLALERTVLGREFAYEIIEVAFVLGERRSVPLEPRLPQLRESGVHVNRYQVGA